LGHDSTSGLKNFYKKGSESMNQKRIEFPSQGFLLEGIFSLPMGEGPFGLVIVCHPHPLYGGSMDNNVVEAVCAELGKQGLAWLAFNFRGVGRSEGNFSGGIGEKEDARAAISFGISQERVDGAKVGICGYSFGSTVALGVAVGDNRVKAVAGISPLIQPADLLDHYTKPKLFISGAYDDFVNPQGLKELVQKLPEPKELIIHPDVDHFWAGSEAWMAQEVSRFFVKYGLSPN
jgi:alpha/beta superfamily hydrolase